MKGYGCGHALLEHGKVFSLRGRQPDMRKEPEGRIPNEYGL